MDLDKAFELINSLHLQQMAIINLLGKQRIFDHTHVANEMEAIMKAVDEAEAQEVADSEEVKTSLILTD